MENTNKKSLSEAKNNISLENLISTAIQIPGVKVNREDFLREQFKSVSSDTLNAIIEKGPVEANISRAELKKIAHKILTKRTSFSTAASFAAGIPGGFAMAATIPGDMLQFYGVALGMAQELAYLYGEPDLWNNGMPDTEKVKNQLILYCGVMLGASGASQTVRVLSSSLAKQALKKLPQKALTKTFYYPIVKSIAKAFGAKMTKEVFAKGVSKAVPIIGGVVSGGITLATMIPMGNRLIATLDEAHFSYSNSDFESDWHDIVAECRNFEAEEAEATQSPSNTSVDNTESVLEKINQAKQMLDSGIISDEEFAQIKAKLISQM